MPERNSSLYMRVDSFSSVKSRNTDKKRSMTFLSRVRIMFMSKKFNMGLFLILLAAVNFKTCMPDVRPGCIPCMTGETAETQGVITKVDVKSYGAKSYNEYNVYYTYTVEGRSYSGMAVTSGKGLGYLVNHAVAVDYSVGCHECSCARDMECLAQSALFTVITGSVLLIPGLLFIFLGIMRILRAAAVLKYGDIVQGVVTSVTEEIKNNPFNFAGVAAIHSKIKVHKVNCSFKTTEGKKIKLFIHAKNSNVVKPDDIITIIYDPDRPENAIVVEALPKSINTVPGLVM